MCSCSSEHLQKTRLQSGCVKDFLNGIPDNLFRSKIKLFQKGLVGRKDRKGSRKNENAVRNIREDALRILFQIIEPSGLNIFLGIQSKSQVKHHHLEKRDDN